MFAASGALASGMPTRYEQIIARQAVYDERRAQAMAAS